jgi:hypothetical protein
VSHIAKYNLSLTDERRLRTALAALGCSITEGHFINGYRSMNQGAGRTVDAQGRCTQWDGKPVVFGFSVRSQGYSGRGTEQTVFGFTRDTDGSLCLVGDDYGLGLGNQMIQQAIENSYVNEGVNEIVDSLNELGFFEAEEENTVQLTQLV